MLKYITTKDAKFNGLLYKGRKVIADKMFLERLVKVPEAIVYSSWRSLAEQKVLFNAGKSKTLNSNHRRGMAVDVINWIQVQDKMKKVGLINDITWDKNHFAFDGESKAAKYPLIDVLPKVLDEHGVKKEVAKKEKEPKAIQIPIKVEKPTTPQNIANNDTPQPIKLSELPPIPEYTWIDELKELIRDLINLIKKL